MSDRLHRRSLGRIPGLRPILIAVTTWLVGTALFAPWLNPLILPMLSADAETATLMGVVRADTSRVRAEAVEHFRVRNAWPVDAQAVNRVRDSGLFLIEFPASMEVRFTLGTVYPPESGLRGARLHMRFDPDLQSWDCIPDSPALPMRWLPYECLPQNRWGPQEWLLLLLGGSLAALAVVVALLAFADPRLAGIRKHPLSLRRQPVRLLPRLHRQLGWLRRREASLAAARISEDDWKEALGFDQADPGARAQVLALRISARCEPSAGWQLPGAVFEWHLPADFPLALDRVLFYLPDAGVSPRDLVRHLRATQSGQDVILVASPDPRADLALTAYARDGANLCACLDQAAQSELLLHPDPVHVLTAQLARQLRVTRLSPYQTRGGITRASVFFGREQLLARVLNREPGNYLLVGGRQLGKTSLMKAIERRFAEHPHVHCRYLSLRDHRLDARLAAELSLPLDTSLEVALTELAARSGGRRLLLLIDEADLFLREEATRGYPQLASLRSLSEEGVCHFMLAGFWDLYQATSLDYVSPIRNFGEVITLGALEHDACIALATQPLARLGVSFASPQLVEELVTACGERANLVAIVCEHCLEHLDHAERRIDASAVRRALASDAMLDALTGWSRLSPDPRACALDRILVYMLARRAVAAASDETAAITLAEAMTALAEAGVHCEAEALRQAFARLLIAYVFKREDDRHVFAVPLFAMQFRDSETDALLRREIDTLAAVP